MTGLDHVELIFCENVVQIALLPTLLPPAATVQVVRFSEELGDEVLLAVWAEHCRCKCAVRVE